MIQNDTSRKRRITAARPPRREKGSAIRSGGLEVETLEVEIHRGP